MRRYWGLGIDLLAFALRQKKTSENLSQETVDEGCATSHRLKLGPFPTNKVGRIAQHIKKGERRKDGKDRPLMGLKEPSH